MSFDDSLKSGTETPTDPGQWTRVDVTTSDDLKAYEVFNQPIYRLFDDYKDYQLIRLKNGLQVMLVQDSKAELVGACMTVNAGRKDEPVRPVHVLRF